MFVRKTKGEDKWCSNRRRSISQNFVCFMLSFFQPWNMQITSKSLSEEDCIYASGGGLRWPFSLLWVSDFGVKDHMGRLVSVPTSILFHILFYYSVMLINRKWWEFTAVTMHILLIFIKKLHFLFVAFSLLCHILIIINIGIMNLKDSRVGSLNVSVSSQN